MNPQDPETRLISRDDFKHELWDVAGDLRGIFGPMLGHCCVKLIEDPHGNFVVARDGHAVAHELAYRAKNPITQALLKAGEVQGQEHGILVEETIVLASDLILSSRELLDHGLHPYHVKTGFDLACNHVQSWLESQCIHVNPREIDVHPFMIQQLSQWLSDDVARHLATLTAPFLQAFLQKELISNANHPRENQGTMMARFLDSLNILMKPGGRILDSVMVDGC
nr:TCP-1/cpn60 chaperonin family protein [Candidatus Sigynarchaeota archaeon]